MYIKTKVSVGGTGANIIIDNLVPSSFSIRDLNKVIFWLKNKTLGEIEKYCVFCPNIYIDPSRQCNSQDSVSIKSKVEEVIFIAQY